MATTRIPRFTPPRRLTGPFVEERYSVPTVDEVMAGLLEQHGTKARSRFHVTGGVKPIVSTLPPLIAASQLSNEPQTLLLVPRRDDSGNIRPAWVRAGAVVYVEEA